MAQSVKAREVEISNGFLEFSLSSGVAPPLAPSGKGRLYYNPATGQLMLSASGAAYGVVESSGGDGSLLTLGTGGATIEGQSDGEIVIESGNAQFPVKIGRGLPLGQPTGTPSLATNGAGNVNGTVQYAYTEYDNTGETVISASASIAASNNTIRVTMPQTRRGAIGRRLYRTVSGGSVFKLLHDFGSSTGFFATLWDDSVADGSLGANAPSTDTSALYEFSAGRGVKNILTHPDQGTDPGDLTIVTHDPATAGTFAIDAYGPVVARTPDTASVCFYALKTGSTGNLFQGDTCSTVHLDGNPTTTRFLVTGKGSTQITPDTLADDSNNALRVIATFPGTITANRQAIYFGITGAGSSNFSEQAVGIDHLAGYTGAQTAYGLHVQQATVGNGSSSAVIGIHSRVQGAAFQNVGISGLVTTGTHQIGVFGGLNAAADGFGASAAGLLTNGSGTNDILRGYDNTTLIFRIRDGGMVNYGAITHPGGGALSAGDIWRDSTQQTWFTFVASTTHRISASLFTSTATATVANTTTKTSIVGTGVGTQSVGQFGGNFLVAGKTIRVKASGILSTTGTPNLTITLELGAATLLTTGAVATVNNASNLLWDFEGTLTCRTTGASGTVFAQGMFRYGAAGAWNVWPMTNTATVTVDTTAQATLAAFATWGTASSSNTISGHLTTIEVIN